jgi:hypothetical protein
MELRTSARLMERKPENRLRPSPASICLHWPKAYVRPDKPSVTCAIDINGFTLSLGSVATIGAVIFRGASGTYSLTATTGAMHTSYPDGRVAGAFTLRHWHKRKSRTPGEFKVEYLVGACRPCLPDSVFMSLELVGHTRDDLVFRMRDYEQ